MSVIPMSRGPGYGAQAGQAAAAFDQNAAARLESILNARTASLGHILDNSERLAGIGGSASIENLLGMYAGAQDRPLDPNYAPVADGLRLAQMRADVAATGRSGSGGGARPRDTSGMLYVDIPGVGADWIPPNQYEDLVQAALTQGGPMPTVRQFGPNSAPQTAPQTAPTIEQPPPNAGGNVDGTGGDNVSTGDAIELNGQTYYRRNGNIYDSSGRLIGPAE